MVLAGKKERSTGENNRRAENIIQMDCLCLYHICALPSALPRLF